ncbi:hypothetical protein [Nocardia arthritidis]|uniref:DUF2637 domain-containing protein n=1 Tax=Nocardia arthritidis TaxID=228602 RepID=A0A6G9Y6V4_9NOCA|nr:hypothetical protein [Nocardia arthritidis]QIS08840.1 hypothetical protein F5544_04630 [Nocardia arthritidis]
MPTKISNIYETLIEAIDNHPVAAVLMTIAFLAAIRLLIALAHRIVRISVHRGWTSEHIGTTLAAAIATGVSAQGMWIFMSDTLQLPVFLRIAFFAFLEIMVVTSALRARTAQRADAPSSVDGIAMWVLTALSAVLSATEADNAGTLLIRLSAPLVAAWGWERSMALERRIRTGRWSRINWTLTPERILVRLGLADPDLGRTSSDAVAQRRLVAVALAVDDARFARDTAGANDRTMRRAEARLRTAMRRATKDGGLVRIAGRDHREALIEQIAVLRGASALLDLKTPNPWPTAENDSRVNVPKVPAMEPVPVSSTPEHFIFQPTPRARTATGTGTNAMRSHAHHTDPVAAHHKDDLDFEQVDRAADDEKAHSVLRIAAHRQTTGHAISPHPSAHAAIGWETIAQRVCAEDPACRRDLDAVREILRLRHEERLSYPDIAIRVNGFSKHAVGRVIRQARKYLDVEDAKLA